MLQGRSFNVNQCCVCLLDNCFLMWKYVVSGFCLLLLIQTKPIAQMSTVVLIFVDKLIVHVSKQILRCQSMLLLPVGQMLLMGKYEASRFCLLLFIQTQTKAQVSTILQISVDKTNCTCCKADSSLSIDVIFSCWTNASGWENMKHLVFVSFYSFQHKPKHGCLPLHRYLWIKLIVVRQITLCQFMLSSPVGQMVFTGK